MSTSGRTEPDELLVARPSNPKTLRRPAPTYPFLRSNVTGADILWGLLPRALGRSLLPQVTTETFLPRLAPQLSETLTALMRDSGPDTRVLMRRLQGESTAEVMTGAVFGTDPREVVRRLRGERAEVMNRILSGSDTQQQLLGRMRPKASVNVSRIVLSDSAFSGMRSALLSQSTVEARGAGQCRWHVGDGTVRADPAACHRRQRPVRRARLRRPKREADPGGALAGPLPELHPRFAGPADSAPAADVTQRRPRHWGPGSEQCLADRRDRGRGARPGR